MLVPSQQQSTESTETVAPHSGENKTITSWFDYFLSVWYVDKTMWTQLSQSETRLSDRKKQQPQLGSFMLFAEKRNQGLYQSSARDLRRQWNKL